MESNHSVRVVFMEPTVTADGESIGITGPIITRHGEVWYKCAICGFRSTDSDEIRQCPRCKEVKEDVAQMKRWQYVEEHYGNG